jgi:DNA-binding Xre family transcriptional regulator
VTKRVVFTVDEVVRSADGKVKDKAKKLGLCRRSVWKLSNGMYKEFSAKLLTRIVNEFNVSEVNQLIAIVDEDEKTK